MSTKGDEQRKKITANTVALKNRVRGGTEESRQISFFFFFCRKKELNYLLVYLLSKYRCSVKFGHINIFVSQKSFSKE